MSSIKVRISKIMLFISLGIIIATQLFFIFELYFQNKASINILKETMLKSYDLNIKQEIETVVSIIDGIYKYHSDNDLDNELAMKIAIESVRNSRYNKSGYFWIDTYEGINMLLPPNPSMEGKTRINLQDVKGKYIIKEIINAGKDGGGFTDYWFPKPGEKEALKKRSYSLRFEPYKWVIGTGNYIDDIDKEVAARKEAAKKYFIKVIFISLGFTIIIIFITVVLSFRLGKNLSKPIIEASSYIEHISTGDLREDIDEKKFKNKDETYQMIIGIKNFKNTLSDILDEINSVAVQLASSSEQSSTTAMTFSDGAQKQAASVEEINATIEEVTAGVENINNNTKSQIYSVESLLNSVTDLKSIEEKIKEIIKVIVDLSREISGKAVEGNDSLLIMKDRFFEISESSNNMLGMVKIITDIAEQINLLALNASIESARAGEAGRGFAVVADEISKLADETSRNVKMIQENISSNDDKIKYGEEILNASLNKLNVVIKGVQDINDNINDVESEIKRQADVSGIVDKDTKQVKKLSEEIQSSIIEQSHAMEEITSSVGYINNSTQSAAAGAEELSSASEEVAAISQVLNEKLMFFKLKKE